MRVAPLVTHPLTRHPAVTAAALASVHELVPGRVAAAIGAGDSGVYNLGMRPAKLETLAEYFKAVRTLLQGQPATWRGKTARVLWPQGGVPLYLAAGGPRTLELAGELADGVIIALGASPEAIAAADEALARGATRAGRDPRSIERWWWMRGSIADTYEEAVTWSLPSLASVCNHAFRFSFEGKAVPERWQEPIRQLQARYDFTAHNRFGADSPNGLLARELGLTDFLVQRFGVVGTPQQVVDRLHELESMGVTGIILRIQTPDRMRFLQVWRDEVAALAR
jgi:5,10-methylenetetrahydromethanopterin reductase